MALDPVTAGIDLASSIISKIWPDKSVQEQAQLAAAVAMVQGQIDTNKIEAASPSVWTSGWRPLLGWISGAACGWNWIGLPIALFIAAATGHPVVGMSQADTSTMMPLLFGMLGIGGMRTLEKIKGVA